MSTSLDDSYSFITKKIQALKLQYPFLRTKTDDYAFSALCIKNSIYKNPALALSDEVLEASMIDGSYDGGADFILLDPNNHDASDLIIGQAKYYTDISAETVKNAVNKMIDFYQNMKKSNFSNIRDDVVRRFTTLNAEVGDESKIRFQLFISAKKSGIKKSTVENAFRERLDDENLYELQVFYGSDIEDEIKEAESRRPCVEDGKLFLDSKENVLRYSDDAIVVNISALSLKKLYAQHNSNLLARNLRYFIKGKSDVNTDVKETIKQTPETFWFKNNGITIICDDFNIDGKELKMKNFSIVNGGQTTTLIYKSDLDDSKEDFFIVCKVIAVQGDTDDERSEFILDIAKATNSQKPIKQSDLKANAPEQVRFANAMKEEGIFYKTKRGEEIPSNYKIDYKNSDIADIGKLSLAGLFQLPASSRNKPSMFYNDRFYHPTFNSNQSQICKYMRDLLYIDSYFRKTFLYKFDKDHDGEGDIVAFAHNARTICISFIALASRIVQNNIANFGRIIENASKESFYDDYLYHSLNNFDCFKYIIKPDVFNGDKNMLEGYLYNLFYKLIKEGKKSYRMYHDNIDPSMNETNFLKKDSNYYKIIQQSWDDLYESINDNKALFI